MKKNIFIAVFALLIISESKAQQNPHATKPSKMSKYDFLTLASESDSLTATVNMFFRKRKSSNTAGWVVAGGATVIGLVVAMSQATSQAIGVIGGIAGGKPLEESNNSGGTIILVGLAGGALISTIGRSSYSKDKLMKVIAEYKETNRIPEQYAAKLSSKDFTFKSK